MSLASKLLDNVPTILEANKKYLKFSCRWNTWAIGGRARVRTHTEWPNGAKVLVAKTLSSRTARNCHQSAATQSAGHFTFIGHLSEAVDTEHQSTSSRLPSSLQLGCSATPVIRRGHHSASQQGKSQCSYCEPKSLSLMRVQGMQLYSGL